jgi:hypothetical protein
MINSSQIWLKVLWKIQSKNQQDLTVWQTWTDIYQLWNNSKSSLKEWIRKLVTLETKNVDWSTIWDITDLTWNTWNNPTGVPLRNNTILYYEPTPWSNIMIWDGTNKNISWVKTIIIKWWNAHIMSNMSYDNESQDMLWLIVMEDENWNWWNIYIDTDITELSWTFYADKSMISYDGTNEIDGWITSDLLKNQLYIFWTLFSENTVWGGIIPKCPYYIPTALCSTNIAKKYDLNYLRRYFTYDDGIDGDWNDDDIYAWGNSYFDYGNSNFKYPVIIEYNGNIQNIVPPLFENN